MFLSTMRLISCAATQLLNERMGFYAADIPKKCHCTIHYGVQASPKIVQACTTSIRIVWKERETIA